MNYIYINQNDLVKVTERLLRLKYLDYLHVKHCGGRQKTHNIKFTNL